MRLGLAAVFLLAFLLASDAYGQQLAAGKYSGRIENVVAGAARSESVTLAVDKVDGDKFQGVAWIGVPMCRVDVPVQGSLEGDTLKVRGKVNGCGVSWDLKVSGDKLEGTSSAGASIRLSK